MCDGTIIAYITLGKFYVLHMATISDIRLSVGYYFSCFECCYACSELICNAFSLQALFCFFCFPH